MKNVPNILAPCLLIAMPQLHDENFQQSVVLLVDHSEAGAMGLIVNQPVIQPSFLDIAISQDVHMDDRLTQVTIYQGGPSETERGFLLHDNPELSDSTKLAEGIYLAMTVEPLKALLENPGKTKFKFLIGYAGWEAGQLENEMARGLWLLSDCKADRVFGDKDDESAWEEAIRGEGITPGELLILASGMN